MSKCKLQTELLSKAGKRMQASKCAANRKVLQSKKIHLKKNFLTRCKQKSAANRKALQTKNTLKEILTLPYS